MQRLLLTTLALLLLAALTVGPGDAVECTAEEFGKAVNDAGAALRKLSAENTPRLQAKMEQLKTKMKWPDAGYEDRAYQALQDERVSAFDNDANTLLAKIDALGTVEPGGAPECGKLQELQAASLELQATVKTKTAYLISKLDQMLSDAPIAAAPKPKAAEPKARAPETKVATAEPTTLPPAPAQPPAPRQPAASGWSTNTTGNPSPGEVAATPLPPLPQPLPGPAAPADAEGYTIEEIRTASAGFFGQVSANLGSVIEHLFSKSGRPTGYILGTEGGGAFLAGVRYGKGTLYLRNGGTQPIFWHGPSVGFDAAPLLKNWRERGPFAYMPLHPKIHVLADLSAALLRGAGLYEGPAPSGAEDQLARSGAWPIYPEIAERLGFPGDYIFWPRNSAGTVRPDLAPMNLETFVERTYSCWRTTAPETGAFHRLSDARLQNIRRFDGKMGTRLAWMNHGIAHEEYHRGQLALYARMLGRVPALTRKIQG